MVRINKTSSSGAAANSSPSARAQHSSSYSSSSSSSRPAPQSIDESKPLLSAAPAYHPITGKPLEVVSVRRRHYDTGGLLGRFAVMGRLQHILRKIETSNEPGLSNGQLMLTNEDLKPGKLFAPRLVLRIFVRIVKFCARDACGSGPKRRLWIVVVW